MSKMYVTQAGALALQSAGLAGWTNLKCDLCSAVPSPPDRLAVIGDFTLATYTGYAQFAVVLTGGFVGLAGLVYALTNLIKFTGPSSGAGANMAGFVLQDGTSHTVWAWGVFDSLLPEQVSTDLIAFTISLNELQASVIDQVAP